MTVREGILIFVRRNSNHRVSAQSESESLGQSEGEGCSLLGFAFFCRFLALRDDRIKRSQRGYKWLSRKPRWRSHDIAFDATNQFPFNDQRTSSNTFSPALPIKGFPRCSTTTNSSRITIGYSVHGLCTVTTMHKGALRCPAAVAMTLPHAPHMHIRPCSFPSHPCTSYCTHRGRVPQRCPNLARLFRSLAVQFFLSLSPELLSHISPMPHYISRNMSFLGQRKERTRRTKAG